MRLGEEVGRGIRSVVYAFGDDEVAKIPNDDVPLDWLVEELRLTDVAARCGAPVPTNRRLVAVDGRMALVSQRVRGPSMSMLLGARPAEAAHLGEELASVQARLADHEISFELPSQRDRIASKVYRAAAIHGDDLLAALELLPPQDARLVLCHGDLHPRNVLSSTHGEVLVDWFDAGRGVMAAEIARTLVVIDDTAEVDPLGAELSESIPTFRQQYRLAACRHAGIRPDDLDPLVLLQRVARLAEGFGSRCVADLRQDLSALVGR